ARYYINTLNLHDALTISLADVDTKEIYFQKKSSVRAVMDARTGGRTEFRLDEPLRDSEEKELVLTWQLKNAGTTAVHLTANQKRSEEHTSELQSRFDLVC